MAALPITRHRFHGDWNYTLYPQSPLNTAPASPADRAPASTPPRLTPDSLQDPELTGMARQQLGELIDTLIPQLELQRERTLRARRGHERLVAPGTGAKAKLAPADRILATVLHQRKLATMDLLGQLFGVTAMTISRANQEVRPPPGSARPSHQRRHSSLPHTRRHRDVPGLQPHPKQDQIGMLILCEPEGPPGCGRVLPGADGTRARQPRRSACALTSVEGAAAISCGPAGLGLGPDSPSGPLYRAGGA
ncbi:hypothetical protein [Streptomyces sp. AV19]|uniref:hypothetical protein n=1 Tax=Streptomyces sp. AV19 TaxID=2793068 RepID=UPI0024138986|nr:hypothetical protein [Streptomyces sp. AV19]MDG4533407.1 hypothetical protein [Streptomyces sp. AV19]